MTRELAVRIVAYTAWLFVQIVYGSVLGNIADSARNRTPYDPGVVVLAWPFLVLGEIVGISFLVIVQSTKDPSVQVFGLRVAACFAVAFSAYMAWSTVGETSAILLEQHRTATLLYIVFSALTNLALLWIAFSARATPR